MSKKQFFSLLLSVGWGAAIGYLFVKFQDRQLARDFIRTSLMFISMMGSLCLFSMARGWIARIATGALIGLITLSAPVIFLAYRYFTKTQSRLNADSIYAIHQTYVFETLDFFAQYSDAKGRFIALGILIGTFAIALFASLSFRAEPRIIKGKWTGRIATACMVILCVCLLYSNKCFRDYRMVSREYNNDVAAFELYMRDLSSVESVAASKKEVGETLVVVLGESNSRDYMHDYNGLIENTPWLCGMRRAEDPGWIRFDNAYSYYTHTQQSIAAMLTMDNVYTGFNFPHTPNIILLSRTAGINTSWLSNQFSLGKYDSVASSFAHCADSVEFTKDKPRFVSSRDFCDDKLLPILDNRLNSIDWSANNIIFIHLHGNHGAYADTFPGDLPLVQIPETKYAGRMADKRNARQMLMYSHYLTSIRFLDSTLERIHARLAAHAEKPVSMVYVPDHGEELLDPDLLGHDLNAFTWPKSRIPLYIWLSDGYRARYPEKLANLRENAKKYFTNDLLFELMLGLANIDTAVRTPRFDPTSAEYGITLDNAEIAKKRMVKSDPGTIMKERGDQPHMAVHRCNTLFKMREAKEVGVYRYEVDVRYVPDRLGRMNLLVGHDNETMTGLTLEEYLDESSPYMRFLWVDCKDLRGGNAMEILAILNRLHEKFGLKERVLVEGYDPGALEPFHASGWKTSFFIGYDLRKLDEKDGAAFEKIAASVNGCASPGISYDLEDEEIIRDRILPKVTGKRKLHAYFLGDIDFRTPGAEKKILQKSLLKPEVILLSFPSWYDM